MKTSQKGKCKMTYTELTDEISIYIASKIPDIDIHTLKEMTEYLVYKTHNFSLDIFSKERDKINEEFKQLHNHYRNEIRQINRAWEKEVRRIDRKYGGKCDD